MTAPLRVALFTDSRGWHERRLTRALRRRGAEPVLLSLRECRFTPQGLDLPGCDGLPAAAFVRNVPGGSFEQVTLRLGVLHALAEAGVAVANDARAIERTVDKAMTGYLLARRGIPCPPAWVGESFEQARARVVRETAAGHRLVLKPLFGACGRGLRLIDAPEALPPPEALAGVYYLQRYLPGDADGGRDWRVLVAAGRALAAMERRSTNWITNRARGGTCLPATLTPELADLAAAATDAVGADYAGVDLIRDPAGRLQVLEVNGVPAWRGLQAVTGTDLAQTLVDALLARCPTRFEASA
ncbi:MAG: hypothetical protein R3202_08915 [Candidatus Competibacterales bacterium]|nr:hypothetical protein [Candidatus Competibacterales bacterium]